MGSDALTDTRSGTKPTTVTKTTKDSCKTFFVAFVVLVALVPERDPRAMQSTPGAWPQFRGSALLTGAASEVPAAPSLKWTYEAGETIESSAAIADGVVYVGAGDGNLLAIDLASGKLRWKYATGNLLGESSPAVSGGFVYVGDLEGVFHAVHAKDGSKAWTFKTGSEI